MFCVLKISANNFWLCSDCAGCVGWTGSVMVPSEDGRLEEADRELYN